ncbi:MAG: replication-relaxation family protein [Acidobacteriales bacterium]|nr:replication-relaxation family protein [Terriglobales bacterium]
MSNGKLGEFVYRLRGKTPLDRLVAEGLLSEEEALRAAKGSSTERRHTSAGRTLFLKHELMISRFHMLLEAACRDSGGKLVLKDWRQGSETWNTVRIIEGEEQRVLPHRPDAVFTLDEHSAPDGQKVSHFFYEADCGTMTAARMLDKLKAHLAFLLQGRHTDAYGFKRLRAVLIECPTLERAEQVRGWAFQVCPEEPLFWITVSSLLYSPGERSNKYETRVWMTVRDHEMLALSSAHQPRGVSGGLPKGDRSENTATKTKTLYNW